MSAGARSAVSGPVAIIWRWRRCRGSPTEEGRAGRATATTCRSMRCWSPGCTNVRYLTGFTGSNGQVLVAGRGRCLPHGRPLHRTITPRGARSRARHLPGRVRRGARTAAGGHGHPAAGLRGCIRSPCARTNSSRPKLAGVELVALGDEVERLRWVKDDEELEIFAGRRRSPTRRSTTSSRRSPSG